MAAWVYPTNPAAGWPNFDGFLGFRNDSNSDFYLLQLSSTTVEARFRNSLGTNYTMAYPGLMLNSWNHFVMTYDGSMLRLYHDGVAVDSTSATGSITSTTDAFYMGTLPFGATDFDLDGRLEDVGLWNRTLSAGEVASLYTACSLDPSGAGLQLCYLFNQGIGGANNVGITTATDSKGNINGGMSGFSMNGSSSNFITYGNPTGSILNDTTTCSYLSPTGTYTWTATGTYTDTLFNSNVAGCDSVITVNLFVDAAANNSSLSPTTCGPYTSPSGLYTWMTSGTYTDTLLASSGCDSIITITLTVNPSTAATITDSTCDTYTSPSGNYLWSATGTYADTIPNMAGCDSVLTVNLTVLTVDTAVSKSGITLTSSAANASYQWVDCNNNFAAIASATNSTFTPTISGSYAVVVTQDGCVDTSGCTMVVIVGNDGSVFGASVTAHPNPHKDQFVIDLPMTFSEIGVRVFDAAGKQVLDGHFLDRAELRLEVPGPSGLYFVHLEAEGLRKVIKVVKL